jgi:serine/threonine protein phosphatase PrpC
MAITNTVPGIDPIDPADKDPLEGTAVPEESRIVNKRLILEDLSDQEIDKILEKIHPISDEAQTKVEITHQMPPPIPAAAAIKKIQKSVFEKQPAIPPHLTYGVPDTLLQGPISEIKEFPNSMLSAAGDEPGEDDGKFSNGTFAIVTDYPVAEIRNKQRKMKQKNDDGYLVDPTTQTMIVTDGVGGNSGGETASCVSLFAAAKELEASNKKNIAPLPLDEIIQKMHTGLLEYQQYNGEKYRESAAVVCAARLHPDKKIEFANAGDSVGMLIRNGKIVYRTEEDDLIHFFIINENISEEEAREKHSENEKLFGAIVNGLGKNDNVTDFVKGTVSETEIKAHTETIQGESGDIVLLCSDALTEIFKDQEIADFFTERTKRGIPIKQIVDELKIELVERMKKGWHIDNVTIGAIGIE